MSDYRHPTGRLKRPTRWLAALLFTLLATPAAPAAPPAEAYRDAFLAFYPMYEVARLRFNAVDDPNNPRRTPVNRFSHTRQWFDPQSRNVNAPNNDTLLSSARLDLRHGPLLIELPKLGQRWFALQLMNVHTDNLATITPRNRVGETVRLAVVGPEYQGPVPRHTHIVRADSNDAWAVVRIALDGPDDLAAVAALQDTLIVAAPRPPDAYPPLRIRPPREPGPEAFVKVVGAMLERNPAKLGMAPRAEAAARVGIGAEWEKLAADLRTGWDQHFPAALAALLDPDALKPRLVAGWEYPNAAFGRWGDDIALRAGVALRAIAALDIEDALFIGTGTDADGAPLDGKSRYRVLIPPGGVPTAGFWTLTLYELLPDGRQALVDNPLRRHSIGSRTAALKPQPDGSIEVLVQADAPADSAHWLPAPRGPFRLSLRAYSPAPALVKGEAPLPRILKMGN